MDSVSNICKYHLLCFVTIIQVKVISGHQVKKGQTKKFRDLEVRYMFLGQIFAKNAKNDPKTLFEASKSVKKQNPENHGKVQKWREKCLFLTCFMLYLSHFWRYRLEILHRYSWYCPLTYVTFFLKILIWGKLFRKGNMHFFIFFSKFSNFWKSEMVVL